jgi:hypothetical protein
MLLASLSKGWGGIGIVLSLERFHFRIALKFYVELCIAINENLKLTRQF